jgi:hypothetical protein
MAAATMTANTRQTAMSMGAPMGAKSHQAKAQPDATANPNSFNPRSTLDVFTTALDPDARRWFIPLKATGISLALF